MTTLLLLKDFYLADERRSNSVLPSPTSLVPSRLCSFWKSEMLPVSFPFDAIARSTLHSTRAWPAGKLRLSFSKAVSYTRSQQDDSGVDNDPDIVSWQDFLPRNTQTNASLISQQLNKLIYFYQYALIASLVVCPLLQRICLKPLVKALNGIAGVECLFLCGILHEGPDGGCIPCRLRNRCIDNFLTKHRALDVQ